MIFLLFFSRRVNLNNKILREVNKKTEVKKQKDLLKNGKRTKKDEKAINYPSNWRNWELLLRQADQDNGKNKGKYISLYQKFCHLFKNRLNSFVETLFKYRWRGEI